MAGSDLNQIVLDAFRQANGNTSAGSDVQTLVQELLPQSGDSFSSALSDASRQIDALRSAPVTATTVACSNRNSGPTTVASKVAASREFPTSALATRCATISEVRKRSGSMSCKTRFASANSGKPRISPSRFLAKTVLPAPRTTRIWSTA